MRLSRNGLGDNEGEPSCAGSVRGLPTAAHRATTLAAGLLQMATWDEMKEYGVDQNTISYNSLLSRWQLASCIRSRGGFIRVAFRVPRVEGQLCALPHQRCVVDSY